MQAITFTLNGRPVEVHQADHHVTLLQYLRQNGLTGSKEGCAEGECGACAALLVSQASDGQTQYTPVNGCLMLLPMLAGQEVLTIEGIAIDGQLHPVQHEMLQGGSQCGYCTPGFVISMVADYYRPGRQGFDPESLSGNLCRCTGYRPIRDAARRLGTPNSEDPFLVRLAQPAPPLSAFAYESPAGQFFRPAGLQEAFDLLAAHPDATLIAGATDLGVESGQRFRRWQTLISLEGVPELQRITWGPDAVELGTGLSLSALEQHLGQRIPLLAEWFPLFASRLIRNRATLGGNIATASPIGDAPPALLALGAQLTIASQAGVRTVALDQFFLGYRKTDLSPGEILTSVRIPLPLPNLARFYKVAKRHRDDISTVAAAFALDLDSAGLIVTARLAYGGVAATPVRARQAEQALVGRPWDEPALRAAQGFLAQEFQPLSDHRGSAAYRRAMITSLLEKFYVETKGVVRCETQ